MKSKKVVIFDLDDTLYNEIDYLKSAFNQIALKLCSELGIQKTTVFEQMMSSFYSKEDVFKELITKYKLPHNVQYFLNLYRNHKPNIKITSDKVNLIEVIKKQNIPMGILTDGRSIQQRNKLEALGVMHYFSEIIISEEFGSEKPHINNYKHFEDVFGSAQYYYIGDNIKKDFITPNKLGWITICLKDNGLNIHNQNINLENKLYCAEYTVSNFHEINFIIK